MAGKPYRFGTVKVGKRFGDQRVDYKIVKSPIHIHGALLYMRKHRGSWSFRANVRPSISRSSLVSHAKAFVG